MTNHVGTVGIVMPMYNAHQTVLRAVQSVMNQTWPDWHLYLINDKSTDDSLALVREHCNDPRITILDNEVNLGSAETRNVGLRAAKEEIIAFLDSDDEWYVDKLAQQAAAIAAGDDTIKQKKPITILPPASLTSSRKTSSRSSIASASPRFASAVRRRAFSSSAKGMKTFYSCTSSSRATNRRASFRVFSSTITN